MITRVAIEGMACAHCVRAVFTGLTAVEGIVRADVSIGGAVIEHDGRASMDSIKRAIETAGYLVKGGTEDRRALPVV
jgi:copper chaperone CopZ